MAPSLDVDAKAFLLARAAEAIRAGLSARHRPDDSSDLSAAPSAVRGAAGAFVTVTVDDQLNGCIGTMEPEILGRAVPRLAFNAAFEDPRLPALRADQYDRTGIKISVLSPMQPLVVTGEDDLLRQLRPGVDGLLIRAGWQRATFLPAVWDTLPSAHDFLRQLFLKAGLRPGHWPAGLQAFRYTSDEFGASTATIEAAQG